MLAPVLRRIFPILFVLFVLGLCIALPWYLHLRDTNRPRVLRLSTGQEGGVYQPVAEGIAEAVNLDFPRLNFELLPSAGSQVSMRRLATNECDLALIQNGTTGGESIRMIAPLYMEVLHIIVPESSPAKHLHDLTGTRLAVGPHGSGTEQVARQLFVHYGLGQGAIDPVYTNISAACTGLLEGQLDAVMLVAGIHAPAFRDVLATGKVRLLSIGTAGETGGEIDGFRMHFPHVQPFVIPRFTYRNAQAGEAGHPREPVQTLAVSSLLVCRASLDNHSVRDITEALFANRVALARRHVAASQIREPDRITDFSYPIHPGADAYYRRHEPGFLVAYAEVIALIMSVIATAIGALLAVRKWATLKQKDRIDIYLGRIDGLLEELHHEDPPVERLYEMDEELTLMRHDAVRQLVREKVKANDAFRVFQNLCTETREEVVARVGQWIEEGNDEDEELIEKSEI